MDKPSDRYCRCFCCKRVIPAPRLEERKMMVTPCCGATGLQHMKWPNSGPEKFYELSSRFELSHRNVDDTHIAVVMLAVAAEAAMDDLAWYLIYCHQGLPPAEVDKLMEETSGRTARLKFFEKRHGRSAYDILRNHPTLGGFMADWDAVAELRNRVAHGELVEYREWGENNKKVNHLVAVRRFREQFFDGFAALNNSVL